MCGIYGYVGKPKNRKKVAEFAEALMYHTQIRGRHSTGFFAVTNGEFILEKDAVPADEFITTSNLRKVIIEEKAYILIGHNRWASMGDITPENAHPFEGARFVLTHNGTCASALRKAKNLKLTGKMNGQTDSEAILMLLEHVGLKGFLGVLGDLEDFSLVIFDKKAEEIFFARNDSKPLFVADLRKHLGIRAWSSTVGIMADALEEVGIPTDKVIGFQTKPGYIYAVDNKTLEVERTEPFSRKKEAIFYSSFNKNVKGGWYHESL